MYIRVGRKKCIFCREIAGWEIQSGSCTIMEHLYLKTKHKMNYGMIEPNRPIKTYYELIDFRLLF